MTARSKDIPVLPLRAQITIEVSAQDYVEAAEHQRRAEVLFAAVRAEYPAATFTFHHRRPRSAGEAKDGEPTGPRRYRSRPPRLAVYHDS
jgi:hypothetical protein